MTNVSLLRRRAVLFGALLTSLAAAATPSRRLVEVWKSPTCGGCKDWIAHLEANGFAAKIRDAYDVLLVVREGDTRVFASYR
jgi:hypothetical protein